MKTLLATVVALAISAASALADPSGTYTVEGMAPDGREYTADLEIAKVGDVYELTYTFSDQSEQTGSAIGDDQFLAYGYGDDEELGVGLMAAKGDSWEGVWTNVGSSRMGIETWTRD